MGTSRNQMLIWESLGAIRALGWGTRHLRRPSLCPVWHFWQPPRSSHLRGSGTPVSFLVPPPPPPTVGAACHRAEGEGHSPTQDRGRAGAAQLWTRA